MKWDFLDWIRLVVGSVLGTALIIVVLKFFKEWDES